MAFVMTTAAVSLSRVTRHFGSVTAVDAVSLDVPWGEVACLVGPNGSGKSTLLAMIAGLVLPSRGEIRIGGRGARSPRPPGGRPHVGYVAQSPPLYDHLTGEEHVRFVAQLHGVTDTASHSAALERFGLTPRANAVVRSYSEGMRRKLAIVCATLHHPDIVLLDEPLAGLDAAGIDQVRDTLRTLREAEACVLVATHRVREFDVVADRVIRLGEGRVEADRRTVHEASVPRGPHGLPSG